MGRPNAGAAIAPFDYRAGAYARPSRHSPQSRRTLRLRRPQSPCADRTRGWYCRLKRFHGVAISIRIGMGSAGDLVPEVRRRLVRLPSTQKSGTCREQLMIVLVEIVGPTHVEAR